MTILIGQSLGRYHILEQLGEGGMATVFKAFDTRLEANVAVKVIRIENLPQSGVERALKRFDREAKSLAQLNHPNIVKVIDYGDYEGKPYLVMPYLEGGTLKGLMQARGALPWHEAARLLLPISKALAYAHQRGMIHRDVKPSNILITDSGEPMLSDFGVTKIIEEEATIDLTGTNATVGTPEYMAPEQATAKAVDHRADIYSLGVVLYEIVTGRRPYEADTPLAVLIKKASEPLPRPSQFIPGMPDAVEKVLIKALAKEPEDRYSNMNEFTGAIEGLMSATNNSQTVGYRQFSAISLKPVENIPQQSGIAPHNNNKQGRLVFTGLCLIGLTLICILIGWFMIGRSTDEISLVALPTKATTTSTHTLLSAISLRLPSSTSLSTTPLPIYRIDNITRRRWYSPVEGTYIEFFSNGSFVYSSFPYNIYGEGGSSATGTYELIGNNQINLSGVNIFNSSTNIFDIKFEGNVLMIGPNKLYDLNVNFDSLPVVDNPNYYKFYIGHWANVITSNHNIPAIYTFVDEQSLLRVHAWGKCIPYWCDWGTTEARATDQFMYVYWDQGFARSHMIFRTTERNSLTMQVITHFMDNSGRSDFSLFEDFYTTISPTVTPG